MNGKGGLNRRISNKEPQNVEGQGVNHINFAVGHSLLDILRFVSARNEGEASEGGQWGQTLA